MLVAKKRGFGVWIDNDESGGGRMERRRGIWIWIWGIFECQLYSMLYFLYIYTPKDKDT